MSVKSNCSKVIFAYLNAIVNKLIIMLESILHKCLKALSSINGIWKFLFLIISPGGFIIKLF